MFKVLYNGLLEWNRESDDRSKLQHAYLLIAGLAVIVAGLMSLFNEETGKDILQIAGLTAAIFVVNAVAWGVLNSFVVERISGRHKK